MPKYSLDKIKELPQEVRDNFYDASVNEMYAAEIFAFLTNEQIAELKDMTVGVYYRLLTPGAFLSALKDLLKDEKKYKDIAVKILGNDLLKIADYLGADIKAMIAELGGDPNIFLSDVPVSGVVSQIRRKSSLKIDDERLSHRLDKLLETVVVDVRKDDQALPLLMGNPKTSGIGLDEAAAKALLKLAHEEVGLLRARGIEVLPDDEYERKHEPEKAAPDALAVAETPADVAEAAPLQEVPTAEPKKETAVTVLPEDIKEIVQIQKAAEDKIDADASKSTASLLDGMVDGAVVMSGVAFENEDMKKRFRNLMSLYFRDLRDSLETKSKLTMPTASGGMGMTDEKAEQVMTLMATKAAEFRAATSAKTEQAKQQYVQAQNEKTMGAAEREALQEKDVLDKRFAHLVQKTGVGAPPAPPAPAPQMPPQSAPKVIPVVSLDKKPVPVPSAPANLPVAPLPAFPPQTAQPSPASASVEPARQVVSDVKFTPKLTGPVEELRALTLKDFRRLSKVPTEATLKIKDKIDLLEDQGFELKTQGIKAWQDSETNRLYLDMLRKSLEGKPVTDVINELEAKGESVLTKAEFDAVMALNRQLRFG